MIRKIAVAALAVMIAGPALAANGCSKGPASKFQPRASLETKLKAEGLNVRRIKIENGCYEVYAITKQGKRFNAAYNAETLKKLANAEAGER